MNTMKTEQKTVAKWTKSLSQSSATWNCDPLPFLIPKQFYFGSSYNKIKTIIFREVRKKKIILIGFVVCMLLERLGAEIDIFYCTFLRIFVSFSTGRILCEVLFLQVFWI